MYLELPIHSLAAAGLMGTSPAGILVPVESISILVIYLPEEVYLPVADSITSEASISLPVETGVSVARAVNLQRLFLLLLAETLVVPSAPILPAVDLKTTSHVGVLTLLAPLVLRLPI